MTKLGIIGTGRVGSQVLTDAQYLGIFSEIVLIDTNEDLAKGEALDHRHLQGLGHTHHVNIYSGTYQDLSDADIVIVSAIAPSTPEMADRTLLTRANSLIVHSVFQKLSEVTQEAVAILISNPVDAMTLIAQEAGYPAHKVIGTGTNLESSRFRTLIADHYQVDPKNVEAFVLGEHGSHAVPIWSRVRIAGIELPEFETLTGSTPIDKKAVSKRIDEVAFEVFKKKGWTNSAISRSAVQLAQAILLDEHPIEPVSASVNGEYELTGGALSLLSLIDRNGIVKRLPISLNSDELQQLKDAHIFITEAVAQAHKEIENIS
ncbi:lactate dehydrogenase [Staphylococcus carnosus]|uniref:lactate/malate family dehydrogenase n=1 Tax=Staphylococcus carnosus TaxID=1281 RepID=UPI0006ABB1E4|nr:lactate dehydrogenase [Staphylococcus carnosus]KOR14210.1 lactate dehydrogenase [Staphylococcus carnosus]